MSNKNAIFLLILTLMFFTLANSAINKQEFTSSKGLKVKFLVDDSLGFVHAELLIFYKGKFKNPAVPELTLMNIFNENVRATNATGESDHAANENQYLKNP